MNRKKLAIAVRNALNAGVVVGLAAPFAYAQQATSPAVEQSAPGNAQQTAPQVAQQAGPQVAQQTAPQVAQQVPTQVAQAAPPAAPPRIERIEVTGSRIPVSPNLTSTSPITQITSTDIQMEGLTSVEDIMNRLPQVTANYGSNVSNGSTGTATVNLRNLGASRTLVLIDGRRLPAGSPLYWATDVNNIPAPLIQRVEVLTGGASAIYGSDAIAGVVNFIMNDHFEGVQFQWNANGYNHSQHSPYASVVAARAATNPAQYNVPGDVGLAGQVNDYNMLMGGNFANGKGNATVYFEYRHQSPLTQSNYDYSACGLASANSDSAPLLCAGSGTSYPGQFRGQGGLGKAYTIANPAGDVRPYVSATDAFNFAPYNYYQVQNERYLSNVFAHYDALPNARVYGEFDFSDSRTIAQIAPSGAFGIDATLDDANPLLSQSFKNAMGITPGNPSDVLILRRSIEGGPRQADIRNTDYRFVVGVKGDFLDGKWDYDFWWQNGKVVYSQTYLNDMSKTRQLRALNVVTDPATGKPACASALDGTDPNCVPWDIFHIGGVTPAAINYLNTPGLQNGETDQSVVGLHITSDLGSAYGWQSPWANDGVGVAFGIERRVEKLSLNTDTEFSTFDLAGQGGPTLPVSGQYTVIEPFVELRVPIMEEKPWAYLLDFDASYRYSNYYTQNETTNSFGLGGRWAPIKGYTLRGSYQQASRAPNVVELFTPQGFNLFSMGSDPCSGPVPEATLAQCLRTGLPANLYGSPLLTNVAGQYNYLQGGNPALTPETAKTYTVGVVLTPVAKANVSFDYWNIKVGNVIGITSPALALSQCIAVGQFCDLIHRNTTNGTLWLGNGFITGTNLNLGSKKTTGYDIVANYAYDLPRSWGTWGSLLFYFAGTYVDKFEVTPIPGLGTYDCAGLFGVTCGAPLPRWRNTLRTTWSTAWNWDLALTWRYFGTVTLDTTQSNPLLNGPNSTVNNQMGKHSYIDLAASWNVTKNWTLRAGVNNLFDRDPPIVSNNIAGPPFGNGNTYPQVYDCCGRNLFVSVTAKF
jgi:outer membrane receptor protein involved in Fe transport